MCRVFSNLCRVFSNLCRVFSKTLNIYIHTTLGLNILPNITLLTDQRLHILTRVPYANKRFVRWQIHINSINKITKTTTRKFYVRTMILHTTPVSLFLFGHELCLTRCISEDELLMSLINWCKKNPTTQNENRYELLGQST